MNNNPKRIIVIRCGALGDLVYATSVIDALKFEFGEDSIIDFVCTPGSGTLFNNDSRVNQVFPLKHKKLPIFFSKQKRNIINFSRKQPYDILINFEYGKQFKGLVERIVADKKVGAMFDCIGYDDSDINRGELQKRFLDNLVSKSNLEKSFPRVATLEFEIIRNKFHLSDSYIVISPSNSHVNRSGINYRAWPNSSWIKLIKKLSCDSQVVIVGAKNESNFFKNLQPYPSNVVDLVGKNNVIELSSVIQNAKFVVCTDSAVGHISASVDTPVFVLMGPNNTLTDSPYVSPTNYVHTISLRKDCSPCYKTSIMKACKDNVCMNEITVYMVLAEISSVKFEKNKN